MSLFGISWQPFKSPTKVSFNPKKIGFGDLLSAGSLFASGGLSGIGNIAKWGTGNIAKNLALSTLLKNPKNALGLAGATGMLGGSGGSGSSSTDPNATGYDQNGLLGLEGKILDSYWPVAQGELKTLADFAPRRTATVNNAVAALDPANIPSEVARQQGSLMRLANTSGQRTADRLTSQGFSPIVGEGFKADAQNQAIMQGNQAQENAYSPQAISSRYNAQLGLMSPSTVAPDVQNVLSLVRASLSDQNAQEQLKAALRQPSVLEKLISTVPSLLPYLKELFPGGLGGSGDSGGGTLDPNAISDWTSQVGF